MGDNLIETVGKPEFGGKPDKSFKMPSWGWVVATIWFVGSITGAFWLSFHTENVKSEARAMAERIAKDWCRNEALAYVGYIDGIGYLCRSTRDGFLILAEVPNIEALVEKARSKAAVQVRN